MTTTSSRVNEIDLLRFLAAFIVMLFHYTFRGYAADHYSVMPFAPSAAVFKYGFLGVELFFLISGFVILMTASSGSLRKFAISRIVRLYPAYWVCCTLTFLAIFAFGGERFNASLGQYMVNMTMLNEFVGVPSIDGVYWSLAVEMKFYALVAVVLLIGQIHRAELFVLIWLMLSILLDLVPSGAVGVSRIRSVLVVDSSYYFIAGAACYLIYANGASVMRFGIVTVSWLMALWTTWRGIPAFESRYGTTLDVYATLGLVTSFYLVMLLVATRKTGWLAKRKWVTLGALTYPLYLIHQYVGYMLFNIGYPKLNQHILLWGTVALMMLLAYLVHTQIEERFSLHFKRLLERMSARKQFAS
jgi:peptidoglycan/LPS O-acetylase OafA/YrhL